MTETLAEFRDKFRVEDLLLFRNDSWSVSLRPGACTLGACVLSANRFHETLATIEPNEAAGLADAAAWFERRVRACFSADKFNYLALMMVDRHLHFHAVPRYAGEREAAGLIWRDTGWPKQPDLSADNGADAAALGRVRAILTDTSS